MIVFLKLWLFYCLKKFTSFISAAESVFVSDQKTSLAWMFVFLSSSNNSAHIARSKDNIPRNCSLE